MTKFGIINFDNEKEDALIGVKIIEKLMEVEPHGIAGGHAIMGCRLVCEMDGAIKNGVSGHGFHFVTIDNLTLLIRYSAYALKPTAQ